MWWKLVLLTVYLVLLFLLSRLLEAFGHLEGSYLASRLLDPVSMSVRKLKTILDQRGVSYAGVVEKTELTDLVEASGEMTEGELNAASMSEEVSTITSFTGGSHFYEEVEDTKDSVWLVQVVQDPGVPLIRPSDWKLLIHKVSQFGVRAGIFDCSLDYRLCDRKGWHSPRLILALPQGYRMKDNVVIKAYQGSSKVQSMFDWVNKNLVARVRNIKTVRELHEDWTSFTGVRKEEKVRVILFSKLKIPPMFYSVLSAKFSGRVKFGHVNVKSRQGAYITDRMYLKRIPQYMILTPECNYTYGIRPGEILNYRSMAVYLRTFQPEVNDIFLLSLIVVNMSCWLELFIIQGSIFRRLGNLLWCIGKWNCLLILFWLPLLGLLQLPFMDKVINYSLLLLRTTSGTHTACLIRSDWLWYSSLHFSMLLCTYIAYAVVVGYLHHRYMPETPEHDTNNNTADFWSSSWDSYMTNLFRPVTSLTRPWNSNDLDMEVGMELLIERLAVPNFWLQPMISSEYIKDLPLWRYTGPSADSDVCSECEGYKSDNEGDKSCAGIQPSQGRQPYIFSCAKCRALQNENHGRTEREQMMDNAESEMACAKFVMDGDYKCQCKLDHRSKGHGHGTPRKKSRSPRGNRSKDRNEVTDTQWDLGMPPGMLPHTECVICLESYVYSIVLLGLPCGHSFHQVCIMEWLSRDNHCCPVCRWPTYKSKPCQMHLNIG